MIVLCEDDHEFTKNYNKETLFSNIVEAYGQGAELLNCGVVGVRYSCASFAIAWLGGLVLVHTVCGLVFVNVPQNSKLEILC